MPTAIQDLNWFDVTGGLNTRKSAFQLAPNEVPEILNMEIDPRGGVYTRKGWGQWSTDEIVTAGVEPYILAPGSGAHVTIPDEAGFDLTGDCQIVVGLRLADWTPAAPTVLACHTSAQGGFGEPTADGWVLMLQANGRPLLYNRYSGGFRTFSASAAVPAVANQNWWIGISFDVNNGSGASSCRFWQSSTGPNGAWTEIGTAQTVANTAASIAGNAVLRIGAGVGGGSPVSGRLLHCELRNAIGALNTMSTVSVVHEMDTSTDLAASQLSDLTFTTASADTATLTNTGMLVNNPGLWNPRNAYLHEPSTGVQYILVANDNDLWSASGSGTFTAITNLVPSAVPHLASFAPWGDTLYVACGKTQQSGRTTGTGAGTLLTASGAGQWQNDYAVASGTHMPKCDHVASHAGYIFAANMNHDSTNFFNRLRWSHPGQPERWNEFDFIDINEGGSRITGLATATDHLVIFKTDSVWGLFGSSKDSWQLVKITGDIGAPHATAICKGTQEVYFFGGDGIYAYTSRGIQEISYPIRNIFPDITVAAYNNIFLGWMDRRLWASIPYDLDAFEPPTEAVGLFIYDPMVGEVGVWTRFEAANGHAIGPYVDHTSSADAPHVAICRMVPHAILLNATDAAADNLHGEDMGFESHIRTGWFDAGKPSLKKSWRPPDYIFRNLEGTFDLNLEVYTDFNSEQVKRSSVFTIDAVGDPGSWGDGSNWGDGTWASSEDGLEVQTVRGRVVGLNRSIALRLAAPEGAKWGLNAIVTKFRPRKMR